MKRDNEKKSTLLEAKSIEPVKRSVNELRQALAKRRAVKGVVSLFAAAALSGVSYWGLDEERGASFNGGTGQPQLAKRHNVTVNDNEASGLAFLRGMLTLGGLGVGGFGVWNFNKAARHLRGKEDYRYNPYYITDPENLKPKNFDIH
ncbi:MAG: hypothetical protein R3E13_02620 [Alphaproteobacteria bacterium]